ncbi:MAG: DUF3368 domain-containing protein [Anaerolineae bacterium]|nr:DUF3368 domain-containing protein [Anaerolineae bacterium]
MSGVLADSTILSNFAHIQRLDLLQQAFPDISIPGAVFQEITNGEEAGRLPVSDWTRLNIVELSDDEVSHSQSLNKRLGLGESQCIAVAVSRGWIVLTDDQDARQSARSLNVQVSGTIGALVNLIDQKVLDIDTADELLATMIEKGYRSPVGSLSELQI